MFSLTPRIDRIMQGIKAGKQRTGKLVATLLGDPQEPADRRETFRVAFPWLCASTGLCTFPAERGAGSSLATAAAQDKEMLGTTKLRRALGRQIHNSRCSTALLKSGNSTPAPTYTPSGFLVLKTSIYRHCSKFSHAHHSYKPY